MGYSVFGNYVGNEIFFVGLGGVFGPCHIATFLAGVWCPFAVSISIFKVVPKCVWRGSDHLPSLTQALFCLFMVIPSYLVHIVTLCSVVPGHGVMGQFSPF